MTHVFHFFKCQNISMIIPQSAHERTSYNKLSISVINLQDHMLLLRS